MSTLAVNASTLNVRETPSKDAKVLIQLPRNFRVQKLEASPDGQWFQIRAGTVDLPVTGWISAQYAVEAPAVTLTTTASTLNVRETASTDAKVLVQLPQGSKVEKVDTSPDGAWFQVRAAAVTGWISAKFASEAAAAQPQGQPAAAPSGGKEFAWLSAAHGEIGVKEYEGAKNNPRIVEYAACTSLRATDDETAWCSSFVNWCMKQAGVKGSGEANARSWLGWGQEVSPPVHGCVVVFKRGTSPTSGHVAFYLETQGDRISVLGGNQSNQVKVSTYPKADVLGYRLPK
ncbi:MAG TPA: TIGR02594 family protein [Longimicrobiaceae bacterium]|jgi:uncharacterized protein (TIGR02594 family)|nr:TIGR02594 family protein [Longimicrobiaceae bacterium]